MGITDFFCVSGQKRLISNNSKRDEILLSNAKGFNNLICIFWPYRISILYCAQYQHILHPSNFIYFPSSSCCLAMQKYAALRFGLLTVQWGVLSSFKLSKFKRYWQKQSIFFTRGTSAYLCPCYIRSQTTYGITEYCLFFIVSKAHRSFYWLL